MSISALYSRRAFRPHRQNMEAPLSERCPGEIIGFMSIGPGGLTVADVKIGKNGPEVRHCRTDTHAPAIGDLGPVAVSLRKQIPKLGTGPVILGSSFHLEWTLKRSLDVATNAAFVRELRTETPKIMGGTSNNLVTYTGLLQESSSTGLILGVGSKEITAAEDALQSAKCEIVRRTIPALAVLNLMLASDAVVHEQRIPLVVDQGYALAVISDDSGWRETMGRNIVGPSNRIDELGDLIDRINAQLGAPKFVFAASPANGGLGVEEFLRQRGVDFTNFSVGSVKPDHLFVYATALF